MEIEETSCATTTWNACVVLAFSFMILLMFGMKALGTVNLLALQGALTPPRCRKYISHVPNSSDALDGILVDFGCAVTTVVLLRWLCVWTCMRRQNMYEAELGRIINHQPTASTLQPPWPYSRTNNFRVPLHHGPSFAHHTSPCGVVLHTALPP